MISFSSCQVATANRANPGLNHVVEMYDSFRISGPHGNRILSNPKRGRDGGNGIFFLISLLIDMVMVFEVLGCNLLKPIIKHNYKGLPPSFVKLVTKQVRPNCVLLHSSLPFLSPKVLLGLDYLHTECGIIHTDIKPENILFCVSDEHVKSLARNRVASKSAGNDECSTCVHYYFYPVVVCNAPSSLSKVSPFYLFIYSLLIFVSPVVVR